MDFLPEQAEDIEAVLFAKEGQGRQLELPGCWAGCRIVSGVAWLPDLTLSLLWAHFLPSVLSNPGGERCEPWYPGPGRLHGCGPGRLQRAPTLRQVPAHGGEHGAELVMVMVVEGGRGIR